MPHMFSDLPAFRRDLLGFLQSKCAGSNEPLARLHLGPYPIYLVCDPALVKPILKAPERELDKGRLIHKMREVLGLSLLSISGAEHKKRRAAIHGEIARGITTTYVPVIASIARKYALRAIDQGSFDAHRLGAPLALRVICDVLFGRDVLSSGDEAALINAVRLVEDDLADKFFRVVPDLPWVAMKKRRKIRQARATMHFVVGRARQRNKGASILKTLADIGLEGEDLSNEILTLILTGHHTTGSAAAWLFYYLATQPDLAERVADEAAEICDRSGEIIPESLARSAPVSRALVNEVLRLYPSSHWFSRETKTKTTIGGHTLRRGTSLIIAPWAFGRDPRFWSNPEVFDIDRTHMTNKAFVPFGAGPRACVGMGLAMTELQIIALEFASAVEFLRASPYPAPKPKASVALTPPSMSISVRPRRAVLNNIRTPFLPAA